jgi:hypothetical protein
MALTKWDFQAAAQRGVARAAGVGDSQAGWEHFSHQIATMITDEENIRPRDRIEAYKVTGRAVGALTDAPDTLPAGVGMQINVSDALLQQYLAAKYGGGSAPADVIDVVAAELPPPASSDSSDSSDWSR